MQKEQIFFIGGIIVLIGVFIYLIKIFIINSKKAHKILDNKSGFKEIKDIPDIVNEFINKNKSKETILEIKKIIQKDDLYILDILKKQRNSSHSTSSKYSTVLIKKVDTGLNDFFIRKKLSKFMEALIRLDKKLTQIDITNSNFNENFVAYSESPIDIPTELIEFLNKEQKNFPLNIKEESPNTLLLISNNGYSLILNRVTKKEDLNSLIKGFGDISF